MERNKYSPEYKAKIVLEILREELSISEIVGRLITGASWLWILLGGILRTR